MSDVDSQAEGYTLQPGEAAIVFCPDLTTKFLYQAGAAKDDVPKHIQMASAMFGYMHENVEDVMNWFAGHFKHRMN